VADPSRSDLDLCGHTTIGREADVVIKPEEMRRGQWTKVLIDTFVSASIKPRRLPGLVRHFSREQTMGTADPRGEFLDALFSRSGTQGRSKGRGSNTP
jgi:hypothetical protein